MAKGGRICYDKPFFKDNWQLTSIAQNKSMSLNNNARLLLTTVGNDLSAMSLQMEGVNVTSASGSNSTTK
jgi:hypothetical protein